MNCEFKILWFENDSNYVDAKKVNIAKHLKDSYNLELYVKRISGKIDFDYKIINKFDLILMDHKLIGKYSGITNYEQIRSHEIYVDIVFYSAADKLQKELENIKILEGAYKADHDDPGFTEKINLIMHKIVKRSESAENLRGLVLDSTAEFDIIMQEINRHIILTKKFDIEKVNAYIIKLFSSKQAETLKNYQNVLNDPNKGVLIAENSEILDSYSKARLLNFFIKKGTTKIDNCKTFHKEFNEEVIIYRNALAHVKFGDTIVVNGKEEAVDDELFKKIRKTILKFKDVFNQIKSIYDIK